MFSGSVIFMTVGELVWLVKVEVCTFTEMGLGQLVQKKIACWELFISLYYASLSDIFCSRDNYFVLFKPE